MLFPKGPRFDPMKIPDVPAPNAYNINQDSQLDAYKRGAFLEKTDRFPKDMMSEKLGPGAYVAGTGHQELKTTVRPTASTVALADKYANLQKKLEDLERVHNDGKKHHENETDHLKGETSRLKKSISEQTDKIEKLQKLKVSQEVKIQELTRNCGAFQTELKDLRMKLRASEHERAQLSSKIGEAGETKKALQVAEARYRDELRERDRKIAGLEKALEGEKKKREGFDAKLRDTKEKADGQLRQERESTQALKSQLELSRKEVQKAVTHQEALESENLSKEEELVAQLRQHQYLLSEVANEYGRLVSQTVSIADHTRLKHEHAALQLREARLTRKLANSEAQVVEVAHLVRQTSNVNTLLEDRLKEAEDEIAWYQQVMATCQQNRDEDASHFLSESMQDALLIVWKESAHFEEQYREVFASVLAAICDQYQLRCEDVVFTSSVLVKAVDSQQERLEAQSRELSDVVTARNALKIQLNDLLEQQTLGQQELRVTNQALEEAKAENEATKTSTKHLEDKLTQEIAVKEERLRKEKETSQRLSSLLQQSKVIEDQLRAEMDQLTVELGDAERFQEAYYALSDEVHALMDRNALAEEEVLHLSKFNAEILGHQNPAQRIVYVDRIRRELAETKQKLLVSARAHGATIADNENLRYELAMYKSVMVPMDQKPRTNIIRIERPPLVSQSLNASVNSGGGLSSEEKRSLSRTPDLPTVPGDMTLDELTSS